MGPANASKREHNTKTKPMNIISLIIEVISGAVGGNVADAAMKENSLGTVGSSDDGYFESLVLAPRAHVI